MTRFLADSHTVIWSRANPEVIGSGAREILLDRDNLIFFSTATLFELAIKQTSGKLNLGMPIGDFALSCQRDFDLVHLPIEIRHLSMLEKLSLGNHRDPFDRLLAAQALADGIPIISKDSALDQYGVVRIWE